MADPNFKKISLMTEKTTIGTNDFIPLVDMDEVQDSAKNKKIKPATLRAGITNAELAGDIEITKIKGLTDPNADRILFWDDGAGSLAMLEPNAGLAITDTKLGISHLGIENLTDPAEDKILFWDDNATAMGWLELGSGLALVAGTLNAGEIGTTNIADGSVTEPKLDVPTVVYLKVIPDAAAITTGDGKMYFTVPEQLNEQYLTKVDTALSTPGSSATEVMVAVNGTDKLTTKAKIDATEYSSYTGTRGVVTASTQVNTGTLIRIDVDAAGTNAKGLDVILVFEK